MQAPKPRVIAPQLPPPPLAMDCAICDKFIEHLSSMAYAMDVQAKALNKLTTRSAFG